MYCNQCGKNIPDGSSYCNFCGAEQNGKKSTGFFWFLGLTQGFSQVLMFFHFQQQLQPQDALAHARYNRKCLFGILTIRNLSLCYFFLPFLTFYANIYKKC